MSRVYLECWCAYLDWTEEVYLRIDRTSLEDEVTLSWGDLSQCQARTIHTDCTLHTLTSSCVASVVPLLNPKPPNVL